MAVIESGAEGVGARLQRLRKARGLSQRELARRAGMPNGSVSMIEQARVSPSIASLEKLVQALPMTLAEFFDAATEVGPVFRAQDAAVYAHRQYRVTVLAEFSGRCSRFLHARLTLPPHACYASEWLQGPARVTATLLSGTLQFSCGAGQWQLSAGDACQMFSRQSHGLKNTDTESADLVLWCELAAPGHDLTRDETS